MIVCTASFFPFPLLCLYLFVPVSVCQFVYISLFLSLSILSLRLFPAKLGETDQQCHLKTIFKIFFYFPSLCVYHRGGGRGEGRGEGIGGVATCVSHLSLLNTPGRRTCPYLSLISSPQMSHHVFFISFLTGFLNLLFFSCTSI